MINYDDLTKLYYSISEVAALFDVNKSLIRYWETEFTSLKPSKNRKGDRRYTKKDIQLIETIYSLVKKQGFTLEGAKKQLKSQNPKLKKSTLSETQKNEVVAKLKEVRARLNFIGNQIKAQ